MNKTANVEDTIKAEALKDILRTAGIAALAGVGARGLVGVPKMFGRSRQVLAPRLAGPSVIDIPVPVIKQRPPLEEEEDEVNSPPPIQRMGRRSFKQASIAERGHWPLYYPGLALAGTGGLYGGFKLMDMLLDSSRKSDLKSEVAAAKERFHKALLSQYDPRRLVASEEIPEPKTKSVNYAAPESVKSAAFQKALDDLYDAVAARQIAEKRASFWQHVPGAYLALASLLAAGSGAIAFGATRANSPSHLAGKAVKDRERMRWAVQPPEIKGVPVPVNVYQDHITAKKKKTDQDEESL